MGGQVIKGLGFAAVSAVVLSLDIVSPVLATDASNQSEVSACLTASEGEPTTCVAEILHPCADAEGAGRLRNCFHKLGRSWLVATETAMSDLLGRASPRLQLFALLHHEDGLGTAGPECDTAARTFLDSLGSTNRQVVNQACAVFEAATSWHRMTAGSADSSASFLAFQADIESMESCVLETGHIGEEQSCTGLIASGCVEDGQTLPACVAHERRVWAAIAQDALGALEPAVVLKELPSRHRGQHVTGCGANDGSLHYVRCQMRSMARIASELLLEQED